MQQTMEQALQALLRAALRQHGFKATACKPNGSGGYDLTLTYRPPQPRQNRTEAAR